MAHFDRVLPDSSVVIDGLLSRKLQDKSMSCDEVIIAEQLFSALEHEAFQNKAAGFLGLDEILRLKKLGAEQKFTITFHGTRLQQRELKETTLEELGHHLVQLAFEHDATLLTANKVTLRLAEAKGVKAERMKLEARDLALDSYFDPSTMSVHLRENVPPFAKKGKPGDWKFIQVAEQPLTQERIQEISREIIEEAGFRKDGFIEIERPGSTIIQLGSYRIVITRPPLSDGWEITAVKPVKKLALKDYALSQKLSDRISAQAEGILVAGAPGHGKSTFAQALAEFYAAKGKIVKTIEAPRDLILPETITQYAISHGTPQEIHDILLLSRPDYTIFDEMRNTDDFRLFADLRLAGIGLAGVVHATNPIDAIQRFVGRIELGVIPQVIDTVIFIRNGGVDKVLSLNMVVKVPSGMTEADLARPVVVVNDFETKKLEFELYSYGEETVVVPVGKDESKSPARQLASQAIVTEFKKFADQVEVEMLSEHKVVVSVPESVIAKVIGKQGATINEIENRLGIGIEVQALKKGGEAIRPIDTKISKKNLVFTLDTKYANRDVHIYLDGEHVLTVKVGKEGEIKIKRTNKLGSLLADAVNMKEQLEFRL
ncbi:MAG: PINc/VapC family ATPase [Nanoarchaeota archaeon]